MSLLLEEEEEKDKHNNLLLLLGSHNINRKPSETWGSLWNTWQFLKMERAHK